MSCSRERKSSGTTNVTSTLESLGNTFGKESEGLNLSSNGIASSPSVSYAKLITGESSRKTVNFRLSPARNGADVAISLESVRAISERFVIHFMVSFWENGWRTPLLQTMSRTLGVNMD
ncbi:hypothetical protein Tco_0132268 [Tanacetum coccineum]